MLKIILVGMVFLLVGHGVVKEPSKPNLSEPMPFEIIKTFVIVAEGDISGSWKENIEIFLDTLLNLQGKKNALRRQYVIYFFPASKKENEKLKNRIGQTAFEDINIKLKGGMIKKIEEEGAMRGIIWQKGRDGAEINFTIAPWPLSLFSQAAEFLYSKLIELEKGGE